MRRPGRSGGAPPPRIAILTHSVSRARDEKGAEWRGTLGVEPIRLHANNREPSPLREPGRVATVGGLGMIVWSDAISYAWLRLISCDEQVGTAEAAFHSSRGSLGRARSCHRSFLAPGEMRYHSSENARQKPKGDGCGIPLMMGSWSSVSTRGAHRPERPVRGRFSTGGWTAGRSVGSGSVRGRSRRRRVIAVVPENSAGGGPKPGRQVRLMGRDRWWSTGRLPAFRGHGLTAMAFQAHET